MKRCGRKISFPDRDTAEAEITHARAKPGRPKYEVRAYPCLRCDGWHLTSHLIPIWQPPSHRSRANRVRR